MQVWSFQCPVTLLNFEAQPGLLLILFVLMILIDDMAICMRRSLQPRRAVPYGAAGADYKRVGVRHLDREMLPTIKEKPVLRVHLFASIVLELKN